MYYTSTNNEFIKNIKKLNNKKYRDLNGEFLIEGEHLVNEALKTDVVKYIILEEDTSFSTDKKVIRVSKNVLKYITNLDTPQPIMAVCNKKLPKDPGSKVMILDNIQDPGNLGTIIRSCVAFNIDTLILSLDSVDLYNPKVLRATQGMIFHLNIITTNIVEIIKKLKAENYNVVGTDVVNGITVNEFEKEKKFAIIMGNEGKGISEEIKQLIDKNIYIPISKSCESLNVGVAASIIMYELR